MFGWNRRTQGWVLGLTVWLLVGAGLFGAVWGLDSHQRHLFDTMKSSRMTAGTLVSKDTANHDSFEYQYVDQHGDRHLGGGSGDGQEQGDPADLAVGTEITVWYSPEHPDVSCYCTPEDNAASGLYVQEVIISQFVSIPLAVVAGFARGRTKLVFRSVGGQRQGTDAADRKPRSVRR